jgi:hypothetical protein
MSMVRPESWSSPAGVSPVRVGADAPGSRPRFVVERWRAERGVESLFWEGASVRAAALSEFCSLVTFTTEKPSRSFHGEGHVCRARVGDAFGGFFRGMGSGTYVWTGLEQERPVCAALSAKTDRISRW